MLRSAFRSKSSKDEAPNAKNSPSDRTIYFKDNGAEFTDQESLLALQKQLEDSDASSFEDATESFSETSKEEKSPRDTNKNFLAKLSSNPSLDNQLCNEDQDNFPYTEREIYEMQLVQLQEQLVATMIQDQEKGEKLKKYDELDVDKLLRDLNTEKERNVELTEKNKLLKNKAQNQKITRSNASKSDPRRKGNRHSTGSDDWVDLSVDINNDGKQKEESDTPMQRTASNKSRHSPHESHPPQEREASPVPGFVQEGSDKPDGIEEIPHRHPRMQSFKKRVIELIADRLWDFVNEEPDANSGDSVDDNGDPLAVKTLKENINRFTNAIKPITQFIKSIRMIVRWSNPAASLMAFMLYMYAALHGYVFSLFLLLVIWKLFLNYLHARGIAAQIGLAKQEKDESPSEDKSWSDKFQLVLQVARKVQNILGTMADSLEKLKNLFSWQHPATRAMFIYVCCLFVASIVLRGPTLFMFMALGFGMKMFVTGPLYAKFPKVKQRYDGVARIWSELPTDADLISKATVDNKIQAESSDGFVTSPTTQHTTYSQGGSQNWANFCEKLKLSLTETPLEMWEEGRRCMLMNKDRPLSHMKNGKLFLTQNFLCFERAKTGSSKNFAIQLTNISHISKCKPVGILPGTGMAIEVEVRGLDKPYVFGALLGRDELYDSLIMAGRAAGLEWAK